MAQQPTSDIVMEKDCKVYGRISQEAIDALPNGTTIKVGSSRHCLAYFYKKHPNYHDTMEERRCQQVAALQANRNQINARNNDGPEDDILALREQVKACRLVRHEIAGKKAGQRKGEARYHAVYASFQTIVELSQRQKEFEPHVVMADRIFNDFRRGTFTWPLPEHNRETQQPPRSYQAPQPFQAPQHFQAPQNFQAPQHFQVHPGVLMIEEVNTPDSDACRLARSPEASIEGAPTAGPNALMIEDAPTAGLSAPTDRSDQFVDF